MPGPSGTTGGGSGNPQYVYISPTEFVAGQFNAGETPPTTAQETRFQFTGQIRCPNCGNLGVRLHVEFTQGVIHNTNESGSLCTQCQEWELAGDIENFYDQAYRVIQQGPHLPWQSIIVELENILNRLNEGRTREKPDGESGRALFGKNHRRFRKTGARGMTCVECKQTVVLDRNEKNPLCPNCGAEAKLSKQETIEL